MKTMTRLVAIVAMLMIGFACNAQVNVSFKEAKNYFVKNDANIITKKINSQKEFDRYFGAAAVMGKDGTPTKIDFNKEFVIAVVNNVTDQPTEIVPQSLVSKDGELTFTYELRKVDQKMSYSIRPMILLIVDMKYARENVNYVAKTITKTVVEK